MIKHDTKMPTNFVEGQKVVLARVTHKDFIGKTGTIKRIFKTKKTAMIVTLAGFYEAKLENLDAAP